MKNKLPVYLILIFCLFFFTVCNAYAQSDTSVVKTKNRKQVYTLGYQIGGYTYFGTNYEHKFAPRIGWHFGIGFSGYTAGFKLHFNDCKECPMINIAFKDGGFGHIGTVGAEFASRLFNFNKNGSLAAYAQFGYGYITYLSSQKHSELFGNKNAPEGIFTFGVGLNFW
jgi:opacity protein-like surface antigen